MDPARPRDWTVQAQAAYVREGLGHLSSSLRFEYVLHLVDRLTYVLRAMFPERLPGLSTRYATADRLVADLRGRLVDSAPIAGVARRARRLQPGADGQVPAGWGPTATFYVGLLLERLALVDLDSLAVPRNDGTPEPLDLMAWEALTSLLCRSEARVDAVPLNTRADRPLSLEYEQERHELARLLTHGTVDEAMSTASRATAADIGAFLAKLGFADEVRPAVRDKRPSGEPPMW